MFSPFLGLSLLVLAWREALMVFCNFLIFFAIFSEFSILGQGGTDTNDNFYFLSFSAFLNLFWFEEKPLYCFLIFRIFSIFLEFFITSRVGIDRNDNFFFFSFLAFPNLFWLEKKPPWCFIIFRIFLLCCSNSLLQIE